MAAGRRRRRVGVRVFVRRSGAPLTEGVPGFYTVDGFYKVLLPNLPAATRQVASESWVLGKDAQIDPTSPQVLTLQRDVIALYTDGLRQAWDALLADLDVEPMRNLQQAVQDLYILASPQSPMRDLLAGITRQLTLTGRRRRRPALPARRRERRRRGRCRRAGGQQCRRPAAGDLLGQAAGPPPEPPGKAIEDRYAALIDFVGKGPGAPIDNVLKLMNDLQVQLAKLAAAPPAARGGARRRRRSGAVAAGRGEPRSAAGGALAAGDGDQRQSVAWRRCAGPGEEGVRRAGRAGVAVQAGGCRPLPVHARLDQ